MDDELPQFVTKDALLVREVLQRLVGAGYTKINWNTPEEMIQAASSYLLVDPARVLWIAARRESRYIALAGSGQVGDSYRTYGTAMEFLAAAGVPGYNEQ